MGILSKLIYAAYCYQNEIREEGMTTDKVWDALSKVYNMKDVPEAAKEIVGDVMLGLSADGCVGCAFSGVEEWDMPCAKCKRNSKDYWRPVKR